MRLSPREMFFEHMHKRNAEIVEPKPTPPVVETGYLGIWMGGGRHYEDAFIRGFSVGRPVGDFRLEDALLSKVLPS